MNIIPIDTSRKNMCILKRVKKVKDLKYILLSVGTEKIPLPAVER